MINVNSVSFVIYQLQSCLLIFSILAARCGTNLESRISEHMLQNNFVSSYCEIALRCMLQNPFDDNISLVHIMSAPDGPHVGLMNLAIREDYDVLLQLWDWPYTTLTLSPCMTLKVAMKIPPWSKIQTDTKTPNSHQHQRPRLLTEIKQTSNGIRAWVSNYTPAQWRWWEYTGFILSVRPSVHLQTTWFLERNSSLVLNFNFKFHMHVPCG